jgi:hypothetical protein
MCKILLMPANLPPQYFEAEKKYKLAKTIPEKIAILEEMLSIIPKHKGTEKVQGQIKSKIAKLKQEAKKKPSISRTTLYFVEKHGAAQVVIAGPPNAGKSQLLACLTNAQPEIAPYPFTTAKPFAGMMEYEDIQIQLVDTPPITEDSEPWLFGIIRNADMLLLTVDIGSDEVLEDVEKTIKKLEDVNIKLHEGSKKVIVCANKCDEPDAQERLQLVKEQLKDRFLILPISATQKVGLDDLRKQIFKNLDIIRVYTKAPGEKIDKEDCVVLKKGATVLDAAAYIHKDFARNLKYTRLWDKSGKINGLRVERNYVLNDGDIVEFHT